MLLEAGPRGRADEVVRAPSPGVRELEHWPVLRSGESAPGRDVALDLLRGLAMVILVVNHAQLPAWLAVATSSVLSAAEVLVPVSGVAVGMVYRRRWEHDGPRAVTAQLLRRARKLYLASVVVIALVGLATLVPGLATDAVTVSRGGRQLYDFDGPIGLALSIVTLEAGPWQFNILGFFVVALAIAPGILWLLHRGRWAPVLAASVAVYAVGRLVDVDVLPAQSEGPFPILVWQVLFVPGMVVGFHRHRVRAAVGQARAYLGALTAVAAVAAACLQVGLAPAAVLEWQAAHFDKATLDPARILVMTSLTLAIYLAMRRHARHVERLLGWLLLPLGRNSFYVFIVHVPLCIVIASVPVLTGAGLGMAGNSAVLVACVGVLVLLTRNEILFRWIPR